MNQSGFATINSLKQHIWTCSNHFNAVVPKDVVLPPEHQHSFLEDFVRVKDFGSSQIYGRLPRRKKRAVVVKIGGHNFIGKIEVLAPVKNDTTAITSSIKAEARYTSMEAELTGPSTQVSTATSNPIKHRVNPSMIHSMVIMRRLSVEIGPKP